MSSSGSCCILSINLSDTNHVDTILHLGKKTYCTTIIEQQTIVIDFVCSRGLTNIRRTSFSLTLGKRILIHGYISIARLSHDGVNVNFSLINEVLDHVFELHALVFIMTLNVIIGPILVIFIPIRLRFGLIKWLCFLIYNHIIWLHAFENNVQGFPHGCELASWVIMTHLAKRILRNSDCICLIALSIWRMCLRIMISLIC